MKKITSIIMVIVIMMTSCCLFSCSNNLKIYNRMSLEDAYEAGWLTEDDLKTIADLWNNNKTYSEIPLSKEKENNIRHTYLQLVGVYKSFPDATVNDISVFHYYGIYNGYAVAFLRDRYFKYDYKYWKEKEIGGVIFYDYNRPLLVYDTNS